MTVGVVIPAYQPDIQTLRQYIVAIRTHLDPTTIRVELDAPTDEQQDQLSTIPATVNTEPVRRGKGAALTDGFDALDTEVRAFADADGATPAPELDRIVSTVTDDNIDLAVGSRRHPDATVNSSQSPLRESLGDGFAWLARHMLDVSLSDYQCGAKAMTAASWRQISQHLTASGFAWDVELIAVAGAVDLQVREVPIEWYDRPDSTVNPVRTSLDLATALGRARLKSQRLDPGPVFRTVGAATNRKRSLADQDPSPRNNE